jgi:hypothetical protein
LSCNCAVISSLFLFPVLLEIVLVLVLAPLFERSSDVELIPLSAVVAAEDVLAAAVTTAASFSRVGR